MKRVNKKATTKRSKHVHKKGMGEHPGLGEQGHFPIPEGDRNLWIKLCLFLTHHNNLKRTN